MWSHVKKLYLQFHKTYDHLTWQGSDSKEEAQNANA